MKSIIKALLLGSAGSIAIAGAALAADLSRAYTPPVAPVWNWAGFYAGFNGGFGWVSDPVLFSGPSQIGVRPTTSGSLLGLQLGYNWQWTPEWVFGVETDADWAGLFGSQRASAFGFVNTDPVAIIAQQRVSALGTLRGRVGYALDNVLLYGTGGFAYGRTTLNTSVSDVLNGQTCGPVGFCAGAASTQWMTGWAAGVGFDWAFLPRWSFRTEYLHYDLGSRRQNLIDSAVPAFASSSSATFRGDVLRGAISFKLN